MDNKQDRQFYWEVKDFLQQKPQTHTPKIKQPDVVSIVKNVLEQNKVYKQSSFNPNINSVNTIRQAIGAMESAKMKGTPDCVAFTKNIPQNPFGVIKEGIFDILAADKKEDNYFAGKGMMTAKKNEISPLIANPNARDINLAPMPTSTTSDFGYSADKLSTGSFGKSELSSPAPTFGVPKPAAKEPKAVPPSSTLSGKDVNAKLKPPAPASDIPSSERLIDLEANLQRAKAMDRYVGKEGSKERTDAMSQRQQAIAQANIELQAEKKKQALKQKQDTSTSTETPAP
jgi:hypothetical protein